MELKTAAGFVILMVAWLAGVLLFNDWLWRPS